MYLAFLLTDAFDKETLKGNLGKYASNPTGHLVSGKALDPDIRAISYPVHLLMTDCQPVPDVGGNDTLSLLSKPRISVHLGVLIFALLIKISVAMAVFRIQTGAYIVNLIIPPPIQIHSGEVYNPKRSVLTFIPFLMQFSSFSYFRFV